MKRIEQIKLSIEAKHSRILKQSYIFSSKDAEFSNGINNVFKSI